MGHSPSHREGQFQFSGGGNEESLLSLIGHVVNSLYSSHVYISVTSEWRAEGDIGEGVEKRYRFGRSLLELTTCSRCCRIQVENVTRMESAHANGRSDGFFGENDEYDRLGSFVLPVSEDTLQGSAFRERVDAR